MSESVASLLLGTSTLWILLVASAIAARTRRPLARSSGPARPVSVTGLFAVAAHGLHFAEEFVLRLDRALPVFLGLAPWPRAGFVAINLGFVAVWLAALVVRGRPRRSLDLFLWFLAIASCANAVVHPVIAAGRGAYFPGLWTSPVSGIAGVLLLRGLLRATANREPTR